MILASVLPPAIYSEASLQQTGRDLKETFVKVKVHWTEISMRQPLPMSQSKNNLLNDSPVHLLFILYSCLQVSPTYCFVCNVVIFCYTAEYCQARKWPSCGNFYVAMIASPWHLIVNDDDAVIPNKQK